MQLPTEVVGGLKSGSLKPEADLTYKGAIIPVQWINEEVRPWLGVVKSHTAGVDLCGGLLGMMEVWELVLAVMKILLLRIAVSYIF